MLGWAGNRDSSGDLPLEFRDRPGLGLRDSKRLKIILILTGNDNLTGNEKIEDARLKLV